MSNPPYYSDGSYGYYDVTPKRPSFAVFKERANKLEAEYWRMYGYTRIPIAVFIAKAEKIHDGKITKRQAFNEIRASYRG